MYPLQMQDIFNNYQFGFTFNYKIVTFITKPKFDLIHYLRCYTTDIMQLSAGDYIPVRNSLKNRFASKCLQ